MHARCEQYSEAPPSRASSPVEAASAPLDASLQRADPQVGARYGFREAFLSKPIKGDQ